jgi:hypothetical protein
MSVNVGLQLFPPPPPRQKMPKVLSTTNRLVYLQSPLISAAERAKSTEIPHSRQSSLSGYQPAIGARMYTADNHISPDAAASPSVQLGPELSLSYTSLSDAPTLVRSQSIVSHCSIAGPKISTPDVSSGAEPTIRSIFPRYNPALPLEQQLYYPTQASSTRIPRTVISSASDSPTFEGRMPGTLSASPTIERFPGRGQDFLVAPKPSTTDELKGLWKVTNGWRAPASEGRSFCLEMTSAIEMPVYTLSSATHPFYTLRLDPTSTSAMLTLTRYNPNKPIKSSSPQKKTGKSVAGTDAISTVVEESARRFPPNDGLVALLHPRAAVNMVIDLTSKSNGPETKAITEAAERECGRLFWDDDGKKYYLMHPAMATPFRVLISSSPAWSRVEYTLEHPELPKNLVKLTRNGSGGGTLEVDTGVAAQVDCFYIVDVAICATLLVAVVEEKMKNFERFDAPPELILDPNAPKGKKSRKAKAAGIDLESQSNLTGDKGISNLSDSTRGVPGLLFLACKFVVWLFVITGNAVVSLVTYISNSITKV